MKDQTKAYIYAIFAVLLWSTAASAFKISLRFLDYLNLLFLSSITAGFSLLIILIFQHKLKSLLTVTKKELLYSAFLGFLNPFLYYLILFKAYSLIPAQQAQPLNFIWPLMIVLLSIPILKQKISYKSIIAIVISFLGVIIISSRGTIRNMNGSNPFGIFLALFSSLVWAFFWIYNLKDKRDEILKLFLSFLFGTIFITILITASKKSINLHFSGMTGAIYIGLFEMGITFFFWLKALKLSESTAKVNNLIYLTPFLSMILINFIVGENILFSTFIGLIFIVSGILVQSSLELIPKKKN